MDSHDLQGVKSNHEGFLKLAHEAAVYAAAVADRVQRSHPRVPPGTLALDSASPDQANYSPKHVEALTEYVI